MNKTSILALLLAISCLPAYSQQTAATSFTTISINNGVVTKGDKYHDILKTLFPELKDVPFSRNQDAGLTVKILIDSPQVIDVSNTVVPQANEVSNAYQSEYRQTEQYIYKVRYYQKVFKVMLLDNRGTLISQKELPEGILFTANYTMTVNINECVTPDYFAIRGELTPQRITQQFLTNNPPKNFNYKTDIQLALNQLAQSNTTAGL